MSLDRATVAELRAEVRREIRLAGLFDVPARPSLPPPYDLEAEQIVCSALLCQDARPERFAPLQATHFYAHLFGAVYATAASFLEIGATPTVPRMLAAMQRAGWEGPERELHAELLTIRDATPLVLRLEERARRIVELAEARALLAELARVDLALRLGETTAAAARAAIGGTR